MNASIALRTYALEPAPEPEMATRRAEFEADLIALFGRRAPVVMRGLRWRSGVHPHDAPTDAQWDAMEAELRAALEATGTWWEREEPTWLRHYGFRPQGDLLVWIQHLRLEMGEDPEVFAPRPGKPGDPMWTRTSRWLGARLSELLTEEGIPPLCHPLLKAQARRQICARYNLESTRLLPASICQREAIDLMLRCELYGIREVLDLSYVEEQLQEQLRYRS